MSDTFYYDTDMTIDPSIRFIVDSIFKRLEILRRNQSLYVYAYEFRDEAIDIETDQLLALLTTYEKRGLIR